ncbi:DUF2336 domain-containing protein [Hyphococcus flavus]|uniref:DUF2336 domain-containing protein n=1 Tax=Hyphococcus flavus TaxID=1866326 RepID=A0AAE9ZGP1_9PROT|nr:DUF2336 domain-containing protein [Hyphococcus flavus]WDI32242.1 DUF2336 domain-containing protein [Hyphococcus flavus]
MTDFDAVEDARPGSSDVGALLTPLSASGPSVRTLLVRKLNDIVVLPAGRISSNERALVADILLQVLDKVEPELRAEVARRVARVAESPPALVRMLLLDEPAVAEKIITTADSLPEALLIEAAHEGAMAHRMMIARRIDLSTSVADACIAYEEMDVCKLVLKREECLLSPAAVNKLVALSAVNKELQTHLLRRRELEPAHGFIMFWWVDGERRRRILNRFAMDRSTVQDALSDLYPRVFRGGDNDMVVKEILILAERRHRPRGVNGEPVSMDIVKRTLSAACKYPSQEVIDAIAMIGGVSRDLSGRIVRDNGGEPMAVLCKSLGVPREEFYDFFAKAADDDAAKQKAEALLAIFDSMARDFARAVLRYWDWESNPRIAHITRLMTKVQDEIGITNLDELQSFQ